MNYQVRHDLKPHSGRPLRRTALDGLVELASSMKVGDAAFLTNSEAQTFRIILAAQGFHCVSDGYLSPGGSYPARTWVFKLAPPAAQEPGLNYEI